jgi:hypothetical protein
MVGVATPEAPSTTSSPNLNAVVRTSSSDGQITCPNCPRTFANAAKARFVPHYPYIFIC